MIRFVFFVFLATVATGSADATAEPRSIAVRLDGHPVRGALAHVTQGPDTSRVVPVDGALRVDDGDRIVTIATRDGFASTPASVPGPIELTRDCAMLTVDTVDRGRGRPMQVRLRALTREGVYVMTTGAGGRGQVCLPVDQYAAEIDAVDQTSLLAAPSLPGTGRRGSAW